MVLGIDTSNYTTSLALYDGENVVQKKQLLPVKEGQLGLRQSDAVFHHTVNLPVLFEEIKTFISPGELNAVGVSSRPRGVENSYMPCFLSGVSAAYAISAAMNIPLYKASHQVGHILAVLYSLNKLDLVKSPFIAFHLSGGTTEALLVTPDKDEIISAEIIAKSSDLKAGQAVDRTGVMLGLPFPCGASLERLALKSNTEYKINVPFKGLECSLSGVENKCKKMFSENALDEDIARFCLSYISAALEKMTSLITEKYGDMPLIYSGGVMSNTIIADKIKSIYENAFFAPAEFSCDNAVGTAVQAYIKHGEQGR